MDVKLRITQLTLLMVVSMAIRKMKVAKWILLAWVIPVIGFFVFHLWITRLPKVREHLPPSANPLFGPADGTDLCYAIGRGVAFEFTISEESFRKWVGNTMILSCQADHTALF